MMAQRESNMANIEIRLSTGSTTDTNISDIRNSIGGKPAESSTIGSTASRGGAKSHVLKDNGFGVNNLWDDVTQQENIDGTVNYRCVYIFNNPDGPNPGDFINGSAYIGKSTYDKFMIGITEDDSNQAGINNLKSSTAAVLSAETDEPPGVRWKEGVRGESEVRFGTLAPGQSIPLWIKRTPVNISGAGEVREVFELTIAGSS